MAWLRIGRFVVTVTVTAAMVLVSPVMAGVSARAQVILEHDEPQEQGCACERRPQSRVCQEAWQVAAIFVGRVLAIAPRGLPELDGPNPSTVQDAGPPPVRKVQLEVREVLRGADFMRDAPNARMSGATRQIDVYTYHGGGIDCGYDFDIGESYLIYAFASSFSASRARSLITSRCTRTRPLPEADEDLAYLRSVMSAAGTRRSGMFLGRLEVVREDFSRIDHDRYTSLPLAGLPLVLTQGERTWRATTGQDGAFVFTGLPGGRFSVDAELEGTPFFMEDGHTFSLPDARACRELNVTIRYDGRLRTRVLTASGQPARGLKIHVMGVRGDGVLANTGKTETTDTGGWVAFKELPPGRYVLGLGGMYVDMVGPVTRRTPLLAASYVEAARRRGHRAPGLPDVPGATSSMPNAATATRNPSPSSTTAAQPASDARRDSSGEDTKTDELVHQLPGELAVTLGLGQHVVTEDLILPETITLVPITGRVVTPTGQPVPNVEVSLLLPFDEDDESHPLSNEDVRTDADGRFQLQGALGWRYMIFVSTVDVPQVRQVTPGETVLATRELPPLTVIVTLDSR
jgi:5-hydroxyisourate hydrolase-like protein (transthyretin family)